MAIIFQSRCYSPIVAQIHLVRSRFRSNYSRLSANSALQLRERERAGISSLMRITEKGKIMAGRFATASSVSASGRGFFFRYLRIHLDMF